jgi:hypothetical protein
MLPCFVEQYPCVLKLEFVYVRLRTAADQLLGHDQLGEADHPVQRGLWWVSQLCQKLVMCQGPICDREFALTGQVLEYFQLQGLEIPREYPL